MKFNPNEAHYILAELQKDFDVHIITQNVDDLHERAGSENIIHLHGELKKQDLLMMRKALFHGKVI